MRPSTRSLSRWPMIRAMINKKGDNTRQLIVSRVSQMLLEIFTKSFAREFQSPKSIAKLQSHSKESRKFSMLLENGTLSPNTNPIIHSFSDVQENLKPIFQAPMVAKYAGSDFSSIWPKTAALFKAVSK